MDTYIEWSIGPLRGMYEDVRYPVMGMNGNGVLFGIRGKTGVKEGVIHGNGKQV